MTRTALCSVSALALALSGCAVRASAGPSSGESSGQPPAASAPDTTGATRTARAEGSSSIGGTVGSAVECHGGDSITIEGRTIETEGAGIEAHGGCSVRIVRSRIVAGIGVEAHGGSTVTVEDSHIEGRSASLELHGGARVRASRSTFRGKVEKHGGASVEDLEGNTWE